MIKYVMGLMLCAGGLKAGASCEIATGGTRPGTRFMMTFFPADTTPRRRSADEVERTMTAFVDEDLLPFLRAEFPESVDRVELKRFPFMNTLLVTLPDQDIPLRRMRRLNSRELKAAASVDVHPDEWEGATSAKLAD